MTHHNTETSSSLADTARAQVRDAAKDAKTHVAQEMQDRAEDLRAKAADETQKAANAADAAAREFDAGTIQAQAAGQVADALEQVAAQVRTTDLDRLARNVSSFARENPAMFIGGAALLGLAATRFLKARSPQDDARAAAPHHPESVAPHSSEDVWGTPGSVDLAARGAA